MEIKIMAQNIIKLFVILLVILGTCRCGAGLNRYVSSEFYKYEQPSFPRRNGRLDGGRRGLGLRCGPARVVVRWNVDRLAPHLRLQLRHTAVVHVQRRVSRFSGNLAVKSDAGSSCLCWLSDESFPVSSGGTACRPVALVSRSFAPLTLGYQHLDRLVLQGELAGGAPTYAGLYVLASNNLSEWRMVSAVQWRHPLSPRVRLSRSKRSWRFYAFALFSDVPAAFSLSHLELKAV